MSEDAGLELGSEFAGHRVEALIGRGGMGVVYRARHLALDRDRALKVLSPALARDERFRRRFQRESRIAASIEHANVVPVHEAGEHSGKLFISMRLVEGRDLRRLVGAGGPLEPPRAAEIVGAVAAGLDAAHAAGLIHRDVKPANALVGEGADAGRVYLSDFGITRTAEGGETVTGTGELLGTADFLAPEQISGDPVDHRADIYALGAVAYFALTGEPPFPRGNDLATLFAHANAPRPRPSELRDGLPVGVDAVVGRAMAIDPSERFASAGELAAALRSQLEDEATVPLPRPRPAATRRPSTWRPLAAVLAVVALVALASALALKDDGDPDAPPPGPTGLSRMGSVLFSGAPKGIAVGDARAWVALLGSGKLGAVDLGTGKRLQPSIRLDGAPSSVAVGFGHVWAVSGETGSLYRHDPSGESVDRFEVGANPSDLALDDRWVWVTLEDDDRVARFDPRTGEVDRAIPVGDGPRAIAVGDGSVWVANIEDGTVSRIDAATAQRTDSAIDLDGGRPADIAVGEGSVWVVGVESGTLVRLDPDVTAAQAVTGEAAGLSLPRGVKAAFGSVWVATGGDSMLRRFDPSTLDQTGAIAVGEQPADVAIGGRSVWTADEGGSVTRVDPGQSP